MITGQLASFGPHEFQYEHDDELSSAGLDGRSSALQPPSRVAVVARESRTVCGSLSTCVAITDAEMPLPDHAVERHTNVPDRLVGAWTHPTVADIEQLPATTRQRRQHQLTGARMTTAHRSDPAT